MSEAPSGGLFVKLSISKKPPPLQDAAAPQKKEAVAPSGAPFSLGSSSKNLPKNAANTAADKDSKPPGEAAKPLFGGPLAAPPGDKDK